RPHRVVQRRVSRHDGEDRLSRLGCTRPRACFDEGNMILRNLLPLLVLLGTVSEATAQPSSGETGPEAGSTIGVTTIVTLGDSITKGVRPGVAAEQTFSSLLEQELQQSQPDLRVINVGIGGERTDQALGRLDQIIALSPRMVTIMYGANDSYI